MSAARKKKWKMPKWMEPYREAFQNTGGNSIENLMNDKSTTVFNNCVRAALIVAVSSQVDLLARLRDAGVLPRLRDAAIEWNGRKWEVRDEPAC